MINNFNQQINNLWQLIILLILPFTLLILITKINLILTANYQQKSHKKNLLAETNLTYEKIVLISFQVVLLVLNQKFTNIFWNQLMPFLSLILLLQFIISFSFLVKSNKKNKLTPSSSNLSFIILIAIIFGQFLMISWKIHNLLLTNTNNTIFVIIIYSIFTLFIFCLFNENFLVIKYLIIETYHILINKKNDELIKVKKSLTIYSKTKAIATLWNFANWKKQQTNEIENLNNNKNTIKQQFVLFIIAWINLGKKNIIKLQKIIINGWKISLIE
ncbi:MAG: hypothetical protein REH79_01075 [Spiroplasma sp.]|nr:hypothetical protein [Spiroplasma sp.]